MASITNGEKPFPRRENSSGAYFRLHAGSGLSEEASFNRDLKNGKEQGKNDEGGGGVSQGKDQRVWGYWNFPYFFLQEKEIK